MTQARKKQLRRVGILLMNSAVATAVFALVAVAFKMVI